MTCFVWLWSRRDVSSAVTWRDVRVRAEFASFTRMLFVLAVYIYRFWSAACFGGGTVDLLRGQHRQALEVWVNVHRQVFRSITTAVCCCFSAAAKHLLVAEYREISVDSTFELRHFYIVRSWLCLVTFTCWLIWLKLRSTPTSVNTISWVTKHFSCSAGCYY